MQHHLYVARDPDFTPVAALGIAVGAGRLDTTFCRWALLLPHRPSAPRLHDLAGPLGAAEDLRALAVRQAACEARSSQRFIVARDFAPAPWWVLPRWMAAGIATREALAAVAEHLGNAQAFAWLRGPAQPGQRHPQEARGWRCARTATAPAYVASSEGLPKGEFIVWPLQAMQAQKPAGAGGAAAERQSGNSTIVPKVLAT